jgi:5-methylcytosine-specific restriction protein A
MKGGWAEREALPTGPAGRALCRYCGLEVPPGRRTFCSEWCVHEWRLRTDPGYLRDRVFARDRGVCALCAVDTVRAWNHLRRQRGAARQRALTAWGLRGLTRRSLWDADHILPVALGGGECDLSNLRTLCVKCHRAVTAELGDRLRQGTRSR